jgi:glycosyltransferase involved in cell wall biosynthesis
VYRSEQCLCELVTTIDRILRQTGWLYEVILVNDFSPDGSWRVIETLCREHPFVVGVDLRRNFGQDNAILTGLRISRGRYVVIMDDDLQHDPKYIPALVAKAEAGADVVYADFRDKRQRLWKNAGSWFNGKVAEWVLYKPKGLYLSPYKVIGRDIADRILEYSGPTPYIDGLLFQVTWRMATVPCEHRPRFAGESNYRFWRSAGVFARLVFSFSAKPARLVTWVGLATAILGLTAAFAITVYRLMFPEDFPPAALGWASLIVTFLVVSGTQTMLFGVIGEYAGRIYLQVSNRPQTSVREILNRDSVIHTQLDPTRAARGR